MRQAQVVNLSKQQIKRCYSPAVYAALEDEEFLFLCVCVCVYNVGLKLLKKADGDTEMIL